MNFSGGIGELSMMNIKIPIISVFYIVLLLSILLLIPFYLAYPKLVSKARLVFRLFQKVLVGRPGTPDEYTAFRAWIVKLFFLPLMIVWLTQHIFHLINYTYSTLQNISLFSTDFLLFFNSQFFWFAFTTILFIDVFFFTMGYLLETPFLKNTIKSVEPTIIGWGVTLLCYPPFNNYTSSIVGWYSTDFPQFSNMYVHIFLNICILVLMGIYAWSSLALGWKASNLTNRGIISKGPYKYVRHPAYICKNTAWLIGVIPVLILGNTVWYLILLGALSWAFIYYLRAMTEEAHLSADPDYIAYKKMVPYKFIPKIW